jgi:hypothetical protein
MGAGVIESAALMILSKPCGLNIGGREGMNQLVAGWRQALGFLRIAKWRVKNLIRRSGQFTISDVSKASRHALAST